jgi:hypothetical protein
MGLFAHAKIEHITFRSFKLKVGTAVVRIASIRKKFKIEGRSYPKKRKFRHSDRVWLGQTFRKGKKFG